MPVIPFSQSSQIMNPGSPVPIASGSRATVMAGAVEGFGNAVQKIGEALGQANRASVAKKNQLDVMEAMTDFETQAQMTRMQQRAQPLIQDDVDGTKTFAAYQENLKPALDEVASRIADPLTRREFMAQAKAKALDYSMQVFADSTQRRVEENQAQTGRLINKLSSNARMNPEEVDFALGNVELVFRGEDMLPEAKAAGITAGQKSIIIGGHDGILERASQGQGRFEDAIKYLDQYADKFSTDELTKLREDTFRAETRYETLANQQSARRDAQEARALRKQEREAVTSYFATVNSGDPEKVLQAQQVLEAQSAAGLVSPEKYTRLVNSSLMKAKVNTAYIADVTGQILSGSMDAEAIKDMVAEMPMELGTDNKAILTIAGFQRLAARMESEPQYADQIRAGEEQIRKSVMPPFVGSSMAERAAYNSTVNNMISEYRAGLVSNMNAATPPSTIANMVLQKRGSLNGSPEAIQMQIDKLIKAEQARGALSTPESRRRLKEQTTPLLLQKQMLQNKGS